MGRKCPTVLIKRTFAKAKRIPNGMGAYPAVAVLRAFAAACSVKGSIQAPMLVELMNDAEAEDRHPSPYGMELSSWVHHMIVASYFDAKAEADDRAERKHAKSGASSYPFVAEFEFKFASHWIVTAKLKEQEAKLSLAEHDEGYSLWIQCEERRPCIRNAVHLAMAMMDSLGEDHSLRVWVPEGMNYELDDYERRSILDIKGTAEHYRLF